MKNYSVYSPKINWSDDVLLQDAVQSFKLHNMFCLISQLTSLYITLALIINTNKHSSKI